MNDDFYLRVIKNELNVEILFNIGMKVDMEIICWYTSRKSNIISSISLLFTYLFRSCTVSITITIVSFSVSWCFVVEL